MFDVIIAGGGPGGGSAAFHLGEAGLQVLVLEKENLPRYKPCGGGVSISMLEKYFPFSFDPVIENRIHAISYALGRRRVTVPVPPGLFGMVMRDRFDAFILEHAKAEVQTGAAVAGVEESPDSVRVTTRDGRSFDARYLIGADGANSAVARAAGMRRSKTLVAALEVEVPCPPSTFRRFDGNPLFIFGEARLGYLWVFPKQNHLSVGIGMLKPKPGELQRTLQSAMAHWQISLDGAEVHGHPIPVYTRREPIATRRTLLVGDAAGLVDPLSGEGIRLAVKSGALAAQAILQQDAALYPDWVHQQIGRSQAWSVPLASLFYACPRACFALGVRNPFASRAFIDLLADRIQYPGLLLRLFGTLPLFIPTEVAAKLAASLGAENAARRLRSRVYGEREAGGAST